VKKNTDLVALKDLYVLSEHDLAQVILSRCSEYIINEGWALSRDEFPFIYRFIPKALLGEFYSDRALEACFYAEQYLDKSTSDKKCFYYKNMIGNALAASGFVDGSAIKKEGASLNGRKSGAARTKIAKEKHLIWGKYWEKSIRALLLSNEKVTTKNVDRLANEYMILDDINTKPSWSQAEKNIPKLVKKIKLSLNS